MTSETAHDDIAFPLSLAKLLRLRVISFLRVGILTSSVTVELSVGLKTAMCGKCGIGPSSNIMR